MLSLPVLGLSQKPYVISPQTPCAKGSLMIQCLNGRLGITGPHPGGWSLQTDESEESQIRYGAEHSTEEKKPK